MFKNNHEYSFSMTAEDMARKNSIPLSEVKAALKEIEEKSLLPLSVMHARYLDTLLIFMRAGA